MRFVSGLIDTIPHALYNYNITFGSFGKDVYMRRILLLLASVFLLIGCTAANSPTATEATAPVADPVVIVEEETLPVPETTQPTEPELPWDPDVRWYRTYYFDKRPNSDRNIVEGVVRVLQHAPEREMGKDGLPIPPYKVYNIGNNNPENLLDFVQILQEELISAGVLPEDYDFAAHKELVPMQAGDVPITYADTLALEADFGFKPRTSLRDGLRRFAVWYKEFYG